MINLTPKALCKRIFQGSEGIQAAAIARCSESGWDGRLWLADGKSEHTPPPFSTPWEDTFTKLLLLLGTLSVDKFHVNTEARRIADPAHSLVVEKQDEWVVLVAVALGHPIRKSLRRMIAKTFRDLRKDGPPQKVIPFTPVAVEE